MHFYEILHKANMHLEIYKVSYYRVLYDLANEQSYKSTEEVGRGNNLLPDIKSKLEKFVKLLEDFTS